MPVSSNTGLLMLEILVHYLVDFVDLKSKLY